MERARAAMLPDGRRLHLQHGPIDLIVEATGPGRAAAYRQAVQRFETVLSELVAELPTLRLPIMDNPRVSGGIAQRMVAAVEPFAPLFLTPMAAVAGAVADDILQVIADMPGIRKAYANNGGDIAFHLTPGERMDTGIAAGIPARATITNDDPIRGVATSGWRGRSHSLGIADSVTVLAGTAAQADAAATLIANAVDLPGHAGIDRTPARLLWPDSDLGDRLVTVGVPVLGDRDRATALDAGTACATDFLRRGLIGAAYLVLQGETRQAGGATLSLSRMEAIDA